MKAAIYNPYLDTLGGGERYTMAVASLLVKKGYSVEVFWKNQKIRKKIEKRFGINLKEIEFVADIKKGQGYEVCFWVSDGSVPLLRARNNILHFQIPFIEVEGKSLLNKMKFYRINRVICNSKFTKRIIDEEYPINSEVVYPPVDTQKIKAKRKENLILSVGRFSQLTQSKRQDILVKAFYSLTSKGLGNWKLVLAGGTEVGAEKYLQEIKEKSKDLAIEILEKPDYKKLLVLYGKAKLFWSASGYGEDEKKNPDKVEHFGISVVEAMAAGCVPLIYNAGGHKEIVNGKNGLLWQNVSTLVSKTLDLIEDQKKMRKIAKKSIVDSKKFSYEKFEKNFSKFI